MIELMTTKCAPQNCGAVSFAAILQLTCLVCGILATQGIGLYSISGTSQEMAVACYFASFGVFFLIDVVLAVIRKCASANQEAEPTEEEPAAHQAAAAPAAQVQVLPCYEYQGHKFPIHPLNIGEMYMKEPGPEESFLLFNAGGGNTHMVVRELGESTRLIHGARPADIQLCVIEFLANKKHYYFGGVFGWLKVQNTPVQYKKAS